MISISDLTTFEQTFTFRDAETNNTTTWAVERATAWVRDVKRRQPASIPVDAHNAEFIRNNSGIEQHRLQRIDVALIKAKPILMAELSDKTMLIADGSHRFVRAYDLGLKRMRAYIISQVELTPFEVFIPDDVKESLLTGFSGIQ